MTFPILGGNSSGDAELITNSLRFNDDDSAFLTRTNSSGGDRQKFTISFWIKRSNIIDGSGMKLFDAGTSTSTDTGRFFLAFFGSHKFAVVGGATTFRTTSQVFRDLSAWYHIIVAVDSTQGTADNRVKIYINGNQVTVFDTNNAMTLNLNTPVNENAKAHQIGRNQPNTSEYYDGYLTEFHHIDGQQLDETSFGEFDTDSGIWKPKEYTGSYGTNGVYLKFANSGSLGADSSGNGNTFTATNLASTDQTTDTPLNNFATLNGLNYQTSSALSEGNTKIVGVNADQFLSSSNIGVSSGKWYVEAKMTALSGGQGQFGITGSAGEQNRNNRWTGQDTYSFGLASNDGLFNNGSIQSGSWTTYTTGDIISIALDLDNNLIYFYKNGTVMNSGTGFSITDPASLPDRNYFFAVSDGNSSFSATWEMNFGNAPFSITSGNSDENGYGNFEYSVPSGYLALCTQNLATELSPTIDDASEYFGTTLWVADDTSPRTLTGFGHKPDWLWVKHRGSGSVSHTAVDSSRGGDKMLSVDATSAEDTKSHGEITSFNSDGITVADGTSGSFPKLYFNDLNPFGSGGGNYVAWHWVANAGTTSSNSSGDITTTNQVSTTAGFGILTYTGFGEAVKTLGHNLGSVPDMMIFKSRSSSGSWFIYHKELGNGKYLNFNSNSAEVSDSNFLNNTTPSSSLITIGTSSAANGENVTYVCYLFKEIEGYSRFGKYTGNGSTDGTFVYTGFRPAFVITKRTDSTSDWHIDDSARDTFNVTDKRLFANLVSAESTGDSRDFLSNGFKMRNTFGGQNTSGGTYIYMAFAENPFVDSNGVPVTAR